MSASPFIKWVGGKGKLKQALSALLPPDVASMRHVEPFVGGGAMFFGLNPARALLCDANPDLIMTYLAVRDNVARVAQHLFELAWNHNEAHYYETRDRYNARAHQNDVERAALFIYLNKTCFNGLHRVNKKGAFNVPMGRYVRPNILDAPALYAASAQLARAEIKHQSFETLLNDARPGDLVYLDPPYEPASDTANFTAYAQEGFGRKEQLKLREVYRDLDLRGCKLMLSNSDVPFIRELYRGYQIDTLLAPRALSCDSKNRNAIQEVVVRNYRT